MTNTLMIGNTLISVNNIEDMSSNLITVIKEDAMIISSTNEINNNKGKYSKSALKLMKKKDKDKNRKKAKQTKK